MEVNLKAEFELYLGLFYGLSAPGLKLCSLAARSDILLVIWSVLTVEPGDLVWSSVISDNTFEFHYHCQSSMNFGYAWYLAAHPKALSLSKCFITSSMCYVIVTFWTLIFQVLPF